MPAKITTTSATSTPDQPPPPSSVPTVSKGKKSPSEGTSKALRQKARKAYDNAKHRCAKNFPGYEHTNFLLPLFKEFIEIVGLPKADDSLDRIDPNGHYEIGNVRWTSSVVQALNKKKSSGGSTAPLHVVVAQARASAASLANRRDVADLWMGMVARYGRAHAAIPASLNQGAATAGIPLPWSNSFGPDDLPTPSLPAGVFHLPSLTRPGCLVRLRGGPFPLRDAPKMRDCDVENLHRRRAGLGLAGPFDMDAMSLNLPHLECEQFIADVKSQTFRGACWVGQPTPDALLGGWFEGKMFAAAANILSFGSKTVAIYPALVALDQWSIWRDPEDHSPTPAVCTDFLFIPDFQVDAGDQWRSSRAELFKMAELLRHRISNGLKTFVGIQNHNQLPNEVRQLLFSKLNVHEFDAAKQTPHPDAATWRAEARKLRLDQGWAHSPFPRIQRFSEDDVAAQQQQEMNSFSKVVS